MNPTLALILAAANGACAAWNAVLFAQSHHALSLILCVVGGILAIAMLAEAVMPRD